MIRIQYLLIIGAVIFLASGALSIYVNAQTNITDKFYKRECQTSIPTLDAIRYSDGRQLSYSVVGCPITDIVISEWNNVSPIDKITITNTITGLGLVEKSEINRDSGDVIIAK